MLRLSLTSLKYGHTPHHHTLDNIEGIDYRILIEADYIVNAAENRFSQDNIMNFRERYFRTKTGRSLLEIIFK